MLTSFRKCRVLEGAGVSPWETTLFLALPGERAGGADADAGGGESGGYTGGAAVAFLHFPVRTEARGGDRADGETAAAADAGGVIPDREPLFVFAQAIARTGGNAGRVGAVEAAFRAVAEARGALYDADGAPRRVPGGEVGIVLVETGDDACAAGGAAVLVEMKAVAHRTVSPPFL